MASDFTITVKPKFGVAANRLKWMAKELNLKLKEAVSISALGAKANFKKTTRTWNDQPRFGIETTRTKGSFSAEIGTNNTIYKWVEEGTRPHIIRAVNAPFLAFNTTFVSYFFSIFHSSLLLKNQLFILIRIMISGWLWNYIISKSILRLRFCLIKFQINMKIVILI